MDEQERSDVISMIWTRTSINLDYLKSMSDEELKRLYRDKVNV